MISFKQLTLATSIGALSLALAACSDSETPASATTPASAPAAVKEAEPAVNPDAAVVTSLPARPLQDDRSVYWEINSGTQAAFIYNGKTPAPDGTVAVIKTLDTGRYFRGTDELSELLDTYSKTRDEFVKKDLEKTITPLLQEQITKFGTHDFYKKTLSAHTIDMKPYDFEKEEFPLTSTLFSSMDEKLLSARTPNKYKVSNSGHHYLNFYDARDFRFGFSNGEQLKSIKVKGDEARAIEAVRIAGGGDHLEMHVYGYFDKTIKGDVRATDPIRAVLLSAQYIELVDKTKPNVVLYRQTL
ncbi:DUF4852 domain-containing protein [Pseudomonas sp. GD03860]|uniref:DUF4852 domain-containing protein n=1 Tax=Pseudomonas TaxID=286 RepID=UPI002363E0CA|nr:MULTISPECIES: DUF4852 domain-containing protein [Pseudomonas]MDD2059512.1 DUF4852 domain-containing protein [Pseudomonas putida]MDH0637603.1 DUF4852 domain-containing protein [Pseudomonas sp. GD03860]